MRTPLWAVLVTALLLAACETDADGNRQQLIPDSGDATVAVEDPTIAPTVAAPADTPIPPPTSTPVPPPPPPPTARPAVQPLAPAQPSNCHPAYPTVCIPGGPDLDCGDVAARRFQVLPPDPHGFDRDGDGIGCES